MFGIGAPRFDRAPSAGRGGLLGSPVMLTTSIVAAVGWLVAFIGQCALQSKQNSDAKAAGSAAGQAHLPYIWFGIFAQLAAIVIVGFASHSLSLASYRTIISSSLCLAIVFAVMGADQTIYTTSPAKGSSSAHATAAGYIICLAIDIPWLIMLGSDSNTMLGRLAGSANEASNLPYPSSQGVPGSHAATSGLYATPMAGVGYNGSTTAFNQPMAMDTSLNAGYGPSNAAYGAHGVTDTHLPARGETIPMGQVHSTAYAATDEPEKEMGNGPLDHAGQDPTQPPPGGQAPRPPQNLRARAVYAYTASPDDPTEISFAKGEILDITDNSGKWWQARKADGRAGIVPSNYMAYVD